MIGEHPTTSLLLTRRRLLRTAFWAAVAGGGAGAVLATVRYLWTPPPPLRAGLVRVPASQVPWPSQDPIRVPGQPFYLVHLSKGEGPPHALGAPIDGILVLFYRCTRPDARCVVAWRPDSDSRGVAGWFRCPCCGSVFTRAGVRVFGPAPRSLSRLNARFEPGGSLVVNTTQIMPGGSGNPQLVVPWPRL